MNNELSIRNAVIPSIISLAALVLFFSFPLSADRLVEFGVVAGLAAVAISEYRPSWLRIFSR